VKSPDLCWKRTGLPVLQERRSKLFESRGLMSAITPLAAVPPAAARAGADLRAARERLGLALDDVAYNLRIRLPHLQALEEGRISLLPGNAYALAFIRTYASVLGLDAEEMVRRFKSEAAEFGRHTELDFPVPMTERGLPAGAIVLLGLVLAIGAYAGWYHLSGDGRLPAETVTAIPERLATLAEQALPPVPGATTPAVTADVASIGTQRIVLTDPATPAMPANPAPPVMAISPTSAAAAQLPSQPEDASASTVAAPMSDTGRVVLRATADAWMQVKDRGGAILLNRTLRAGETWPVPPRSDLILTTGNAGGTDILVDGAPTPGLGGSGTVRRDLPLDPDQIRDGKLAGAVAPQLASTRPRQ
jgi:cytoskeleton protein RodZ